MVGINPTKLIKNEPSFRKKMLREILNIFQNENFYKNDFLKKGRKCRAKKNDKSTTIKLNKESNNSYITLLA